MQLYHGYQAGNIEDLASGTHLNILDEAGVAMGTTANLPGLVAVAIELNFRAFEAMDGICD